MSTRGPSPTELFDAAVADALSDSVDDDAYWARIGPLQRSEPTDVWRLIEPLSRHADVRLRVLVADVLRYLGGPALPLADPTVELFRTMLASETAPEVIAAIGHAFVDLSRRDERVELMGPFRRHADARVRRAVVHALLASHDPRAVDALIELSRDPDDDVRDWATFGLGAQLGDPRAPPMVDSRELRDALAARLDDRHDDTRCEAIVGLAMRRDARVLPVLLAELARDPSSLALEAARWLASPALCPILRELAESTDAEAVAFWSENGLQQAIAACCGS